MFPRPSDRAIVFAALAGGTVLVVAACGGTSAPAPSPTTAGEPTATVTATSTETATATATATASASATGGTGGGGSDRCAVSSLRIRYADDKGGGGAGSVMGTFTFTNTGSSGCTLQGFPGVSYVGGGNGTQVGAPATRTGDTPRATTLANGKSATVALRRTQPGNYGSSCQEAEVEGFRVYPPESKESAFVAFETTGCKNAADPLLQVGPVH